MQPMRNEILPPMQLQLVTFVIRFGRFQVARSSTCERITHRHTLPHQEHESKSYQKPVIAKMHAVAATAREIIDLHFYYVLCAVMRPIE